MKTIDLHLHLDGSISPETLFRLAREEEVLIPAESPEELERYVTAELDCDNLNDYLAKFDIPLAVLQSAYALKESTIDLMRRLAETEVIYAEIRFAPASHGRNGLSQEEAVKAVLEGIEEGEQRYGGKAQLIVCCMRATVTEEHRKICEETVRVAKKYLNHGVCCIDLAGAEALFPTSDFSFLFEYASELGVPCVIHAGEAAGPESIESAESFGAVRIGHGLTLVQNPELYERLKTKQTTIEVCLTSIVQTKGVASFSAHPLKQMLEDGLCVTLNTDNMTVSGTDMPKEFKRAIDVFELEEGDIHRLLNNAVESAFLPLKEKEELKKQLFA